MSARSFSEDILDGLKRAIRHAEGKEILTTRDVELPDPPKPMKPEDVAQLRGRKNGVIQGGFATERRAP